MASGEWRCPCGKVLKNVDITSEGGTIYNALVCANECSRPWGPGTLPSLKIEKAREVSGRKRFTSK